MADTRKNTMGGGHIQREELMHGLLDAHHCNKFPNQGLGIPFIARFQTAAGATTKDIVIPKHLACRVVKCWGVMTGAGGGGDTVRLKKVTAAGASTDISDAVDVSALGDKDVFEVGEIDDAQQDLAGEDTLRVTTASDALAEVYVLLVRPL